MRLQQSLLLLGFILISINLLAQKIKFTGSIPPELRKSTITLFPEANADSRLIPAIFEAFTAARYNVFIDGERRPIFGGHITTVTVADTTFTRQDQNLVVRSIHENQPTELIATVKGIAFFNKSRNISVNVINRRTGNLLLSIYSKRMNTKIKFKDFSEDLLSYLNPDEN